MFDWEVCCEWWDCWKTSTNHHIQLLAELSGSDWPLVWMLLTSRKIVAFQISPTNVKLVDHPKGANHHNTRLAQSSHHIPPILVSKRWSTGQKRTREFGLVFEGQEAAWDIRSWNYSMSIFLIYYNVLNILIIKPIFQNSSTEFLSHFNTQPAKLLGWRAAWMSNTAWASSWDCLRWLERFQLQ